MNDRLALTDEVLLLTLGEEDGKPLIDSARVNAGLGGALLAELALTGHVRLEDGRLTVSDPAPPADPDLAAALERVAGDRKLRKPEHWVAKLARTDIREHRLRSLTERGILAVRERKALGLFTYRRYPEQNAAPEIEIRGRLRAALDGTAADDRTITLLAIAQACGLDVKLFPEIPKKELKKRVEKITEDDWAGAAVTKVIVQAVAASVIAVTVAGAAAAGGV